MRLPVIFLGIPLTALMRPVYLLAQDAGCATACPIFYAALSSGRSQTWIVMYGSGDQRK